MSFGIFSPLMDPHGKRFAGVQVDTYRPARSSRTGAIAIVISGLLLTVALLYTGVFG